MRKTLSTLGLLAFLATAAALQAADHKSASPGVAPDEALKMLAKGNERFARAMALKPHQDAERRRDLVGGEHPYAAVVACSDSRLTPETIFDAGLGDLYVVRDAGNSVQGTLQVASVEYAVKELGTNLILVLGHAGCDAVKDAVKGVAKDEHSSIDEAAALLKAPVDEAKDKVGGLKGDALVEEAVERNVLFQMKELLKTSPLIAAKVDKGEIKLIGGIYDLDNGLVRWLGEHPSQEQVLEGKKP
jgi:carbonic anhydrase